MGSGGTQAPATGLGASLRVDFTRLGEYWASTGRAPVRARAAGDAANRQVLPLPPAARTGRVTVILHCN
jgi:hypothetical protein